MDITENLELLDCPLCQGPALLEEEEGWCVYVTCLDCGCHTAEVPYKNDEERALAMQRAASTWNIGKVIASGVGE